MRHISKELKCRKIEDNSTEALIGFVPTMGYLHRGHLSLVKESKKRCNYTIVSIFVNPVQFNDPEDLKKYPRDESRDLELLRQAQVDYVFMPDANEIFQDTEPQVRIDFPDLTDKLCGAGRPGHFQGVLFIVHNLFQWVQPDIAVFGQKDYQQLLLIQKMTRELALDVEIIPSALVRDHDGLALSSRNVRLSEAEREQALAISKTLLRIEQIHDQKPETLHQLTTGDLVEYIDYLDKMLYNGLSGLDLEYCGIYHPDSLIELKQYVHTQENSLNKNSKSIHDRSGHNFALVAVAARVGQVRLIDNVILKNKQVFINEK